MDEPQVRENRITGFNLEPADVVSETRVYKRRWGILALFCLHSMSNSFQWIEFSILNDVFTRFYSVSSSDIDWLAMTYMITYLLLIVPVTWILSHRGLRFMALVANVLNFLGAWIKALGVRPDLFWVAVLGQTLCGIAQVFILSMPSLIAAVWFGPTEVSTACAIGVFGNQIGTAIGFLVPPLLVPNESNDGHLAWDIRLLLYGIAAFNSIILILIILFYEDKPPHPPSVAQSTVMTNTTRESYKECISSLIHNKDFLLLTFCYGVSAGVYYSLATLLNQAVLSYYPGDEVETGWIGLTIVVTGVVSALIAGFWLDKTHTYKITIFVVNILTFVTMVVYTFTMDLGHIWVIFITAGLLGFFLTSCLPIGFEFAAELTYPNSEGISTGFLNGCVQVFGITLTLSQGQLMTKFGPLAGNLLLCAVLLIGTIASAFIKEDLKRQKANIVVHDGYTTFDDANEEHVS
uniref:Major facilitator superfamily (MFS) profile domain-containing protein n=1 Tax=Eptatretus burgeri TaxID=7764 RepID=A0A8C4X1D0_EPTBU